MMSAKLILWSLVAFPLGTLAFAAVVDVAVNLWRDMRRRRRDAARWAMDPVRRLRR